MALSSFVPELQPTVGPLPAQSTAICLLDGPVICETPRLIVGFVLPAVGFLEMSGMSAT